MVTPQPVPILKMIDWIYSEHPDSLRINMDLKEIPQGYSTMELLNF